MKLIIISNRLPIKVTEENGNLKLIKSEGGLATGLASLDSEMQTHWIGWAGMYINNPEQREIVNEQMDEQNFHPIYLSPDQIENYYEGYSNSTIWPLCHYFFSYIESNNNYWKAYKEVNAIFCKAALTIIEPGDIIWIQDYQLMLLPGMIRDAISDQNISIGYFHHIPFPSYELFRVLPERAEILKGLLGADLVAFHTYDYMRHFISTVYRVLSLECNLDEIQLDNRIVDVDAFSMGINYDTFHNAIENEKVKKQVEKLRENFGEKKIILSVDRLDYSKGILIRLQSFSEFLCNNPQYRRKVSLVMIVVPSRDNVEMYADLKTKIDEMIGSINGHYSTMGWVPIHYFYRSFPPDELNALYYLSDIALVTPIRDGMNLVAKEYLATKKDNLGVLILSEMAGAAAELSDAIIVNPTNTKEIENAIIKALEMPEDEQRMALENMQKIISTQTVKQWATDFIEELQEVRERNVFLLEKIVQKDNLRTIKKAYDNAQKRLIILDYDGTLSPFYKDPMGAYPTTELLTLLSDLAADNHNDIIISSGRDRVTLDKWLGKLPIGMAAEHGAFFKEDGIWHNNLKEIEWDDEIIHIVEQTVKRTPKSKMEIKKTALVWHYRAVDAWLAELRVNQLIKNLIGPCSRLNLQIMRGNKIIEIKSSDFNKGTEALRLMNKDKYDFIMAVGDDTTDEDMFAVLPQNAITIKVGKFSDAARYNLPAQSMVIDFLKKLRHG